MRQSKAKVTVASRRGHDLQEDLHDGGADAARDGQGDEPGDHDVAEDGPVDVLTRPEPPHEYHRAHLAVCRTDGQTYVGRHEHRQR